eukprot:scaffold231608_cov28-Tisochrysis_lutea.AAC.2
MSSPALRTSLSPLFSTPRSTAGPVFPLLESSASRATAHTRRGAGSAASSASSRSCPSASQMWLGSILPVAPRRAAPAAERNNRAATVSSTAPIIAAASASIRPSGAKLQMCRRSRSMSKPGPVSCVSALETQRLPSAPVLHAMRTASPMALSASASSVKRCAHDGDATYDTDLVDVNGQKRRRHRPSEASHKSTWPRALAVRSHSRPTLTARSGQPLETSATAPASQSACSTRSSRPLPMSQSRATPSLLPASNQLPAKSRQLIAAPPIEQPPTRMRHMAPPVRSALPSTSAPIVGSSLPCAASAPGDACREAGSNSVFLEFGTGLLVRGGVSFTATGVDGAHIGVLSECALTHPSAEPQKSSEPRPDSTSHSCTTPEPSRAHATCRGPTASAVSWPGTRTERRLRPLSVADRRRVERAPRTRALPARGAMTKTPRFGSSSSWCTPSRTSPGAACAAADESLSERGAASPSGRTSTQLDSPSGKSTQPEAMASARAEASCGHTTRPLHCIPSTSEPVLGRARDPKSTSAAPLAIAPVAVPRSSSARRSSAGVPSLHPWRPR